MSELAELRAVLWRRATGITGFAGPTEIRLLLDWLGELLTVRHSRFARSAQYDRGTDGGIVVTVPLNGRDPAQSLNKLHEAAHGLLDFAPHVELGLGRAPVGAVAPRLRARTERVAEQEIHVLTDAVRLPRELVLARLDREFPDWDGLVEESGCDRATIERRLRWMEEHPLPSLHSPPPWSAWEGWTVAEWESDPVRFIEVRPRGSGRVVLLPYRNEVERQGTLDGVYWSLAALRPHEFRLKYRAAEARMRPVTRFWEELTRGDPDSPQRRLPPAQRGGDEGS